MKMEKNARLFIAIILDHNYFQMKHLKCHKSVKKNTLNISQTIQILLFFLDKNNTIFIHSNR